VPNCDSGRTALDRPEDSNEALEFDDYTKDPFRLSALTYFRKKFPAK